ncbi:MAG: cytochrome c oxidase accessory protein CcoG [Candidatus Zixiibacteriota bacterium]
MSSQGSDGFRNSLATIDQRGRRLWVYPTQPKGKLYTARTVLSWFLLIFLFGAPFVKLGKNPLLLLDVVHRKFFILGLIFWPQDIYLFVLFAISFAVFVILFTAAFGRLFCGWVCPQTVFLEMVFRKIEYLLEGNGPRQRQFDREPTSASKFMRKGLKQAIFFALSFVIGNTFLAYFIGVDQLIEIITKPPTEHLVGFIFMMVFSLIFYWVFAWFREQACTLVCPYGRLQSVLLDTNSIVVMYDFKRGEPRGPISRTGERAGTGDCIDCSACVRVCPTGIDIRNGTQLECVNCTACIDACNRVMAGVNLPLGLIRYSSHDAIAKGEKLRYTPRMKLYTVIFVILASILTIQLARRTPIEATVLRAAGSLYEELPGGSIRNIYTINVVNKTTDELPVQLTLTAPKGQITMLGPELVLPAQGSKETVFSIQVPQTELYVANTVVTIDLASGARKLQSIRTTFVGPDPNHKKDHDDDHHEEH